MVFQTDILGNLLEELIDYRGKTPVKTSSGIPLVTAKIIKNGVINEFTEFIAESDYDRWMVRGFPKYGDVVLTTEAPLGEVAQLDDKKIALAQRVVCLRGKSNLLDNTYLKYYFLSQYGRKALKSRESGTTVTGIKQSELRNVEVRYPSFQDQRNIASILSSLDDKIAINKKICENLEAQAQALFKHWFVDFAPFKDGKFVESELGLIPEGWRVGKAEDFYTINIGKTPPRAERQWFSETKGNNKIWISISDMGSCGAYISDSKEYLTPEAQREFNVVMVPAGTILLSFKLTIGRVAIADNELTTNEAIARFILPNSDYREFTYLYLKQYKYGSLGSTSSIATAVNSKIIKSMPFLMPSSEVMAEFSTVVSTLFDEIRILSIESLRFASLRDTLLPKLMSGQIKV